MIKIALGLEYCGTKYCGWQCQSGNTNSVQKYVESALSKIADQSIKIYCAGRTDAGVHALLQVVHFETSVDRSEYAWVSGGNSLLPNDISILWCKQHVGNFHARFSAISRSYQYIILNRKYRTGFFHGMVTWEHQDLDQVKMQLAAKFLLGRHDFTSFRATACQSKTPIRTIKKLAIYRKNNFIIFEITADAFLQHMVRNIVGVLIEVGSGKYGINWVFEVLAERDRRKAAKTAPPEGLYLLGPQYPEKYDIPVVDTSYWLRHCNSV